MKRFFYPMRAAKNNHQYYIVQCEINLINFSIYLCFKIFFFIAGALRYGVSFMNPMKLSLVSKLIPSKEMGKIFSITMFVAAAIGLASGPLYTSVYNNTINKDAGIYNFLTAGLHGVSIIIILLVHNTMSCKYFNDLHFRIVMSLEFLVFRNHGFLREERTESAETLTENDLLINVD